MSECGDLMDGLKDSLDCILGIREDIGAVLQRVYIIKRKWDGETLGDGKATDTETEIKPSPYIVDLSHRVNLPAGGVIQQGDLIIRQISKVQYPTENDVYPKDRNPTVEYLYKVGSKLYNIVHVKENHLTWDIHVRKLIDDSSGDKIGHKDGGVIIG